MERIFSGQVCAHVRTATERGMLDLLGTREMAVFRGSQELGFGIQVHYVSQLCYLLSNVTLCKSFNISVPHQFCHRIIVADGED